MSRWIAAAVAAAGIAAVAEPGREHDRDATADDEGAEEEMSAQRSAEMSEEQSALWEAEQDEDGVPVEAHGGSFEVGVTLRVPAGRLTLKPLPLSCARSPSVSMWELEARPRVGAG